MKKYLVCTIGLFILIFAAGCGKKAGVAAPALVEPVGVKKDQAVVQRSEIYEMETYNGEVVPYVEELYFFTDGIIDEINVVVGDYVKKGDVVATLDQEALQEQIDLLEDEIADIQKIGELQDMLIKWDIEVVKVERTMLEESGAISETQKIKELEEKKLRVSLEEAQELRELELKEKRRLLQEAQEKTKLNQLTAPIDGRVVYLEGIEVGSPVQDYVPVICLADETRLRVSSDFIAESKIKSADRIYAKIMEEEYELTYVPYDQSEYIELVVAGLETRSNFSIGGSTQKLESGQFAAVMVRSSYKDQVLTVPANAVYQDASGKYVYKMLGEEYVRCDVAVGISTETKAEITEGLQEGDIVYVNE